MGRFQRSHPFAVLLFVKKRFELAQHGAAIADQSGIGLPVPVDFVRVDINPHDLGCGRNDAA
jgi:hypothetical protein